MDHLSSCSCSRFFSSSSFWARAWRLRSANNLVASSAFVVPAATFPVEVHVADSVTERKTSCKNYPNVKFYNADLGNKCSTIITFFHVSILDAALSLLLWEIHFRRHGILSVRRLILLRCVAFEELIRSFQLWRSCFSVLSGDHVPVGLWRWICAVNIGVPLHCSFSFGLFAVILHLLFLCFPVITGHIRAMSCRRAMVLMCIVRRLGAYLSCQPAHR